MHAIKIAYDNRKQKSYRVNRPLEILHAKHYRGKENPGTVHIKGEKSASEGGGRVKG